MLRTKVPPPVYGLIVCLFMWLLAAHWPALRIVPAAYRWTGWLVVAVGLSMDVVAVSAFLRRHTTVDPRHPVRASSVVSHGLYRFSRNPMYLGLTLVLTGFSLALGAPVLLLLVVAFGWLIQELQIKPEEDALRKKFGDGYREYAKRVPRWLGWRP